MQHQALYPYGTDVYQEEQLRKKLARLVSEHYPDMPYAGARHCTIDNLLDALFQISDVIEVGQFTFINPDKVLR